MKVGSEILLVGETAVLGVPTYRYSDMEGEQESRLEGLLMSLPGRTLDSAGSVSWIVAAFGFGKSTGVVSFVTEFQ